MIKLIKKFLLKSKAKKINKIYDNVENLIIEKKYYDALDELIKAVDYSEKVLTLQTYNLHKIHLIFLTNNFELISGISNNCIESIENNTNDNHDVKKYHFLFVYTIMYIIIAILNNIMIIYIVIYIIMIIPNIIMIIYTIMYIITTI